jgi:hypothetical protein
MYIQNSINITPARDINIEEKVFDEISNEILFGVGNNDIPR